MIKQEEEVSRSLEPHENNLNEQEGVSDLGQVSLLGLDGFQMNKDANFTRDFEVNEGLDQNFFGAYFSENARGSHDEEASSFQDSILASNDNSANDGQIKDELDIEKILNNFRAPKTLSVDHNVFPVTEDEIMNDNSEDHMLISSSQSQALKSVEPKQTKSDSEAYDTSLKEFKALKFGASSAQDEPVEQVFAHQQPSALFLPNESLKWDPSVDHSQASDLPYKMKVVGLPDFSRVEIQIKFQLKIHPVPKNHLIHLEPSLIAKRKLCLKDGVDDLPVEFKKKLLYLDCFVVSDLAGDESQAASGFPDFENNYALNANGKLSGEKFKSCNICSKCVKREVKRASRRKKGVSEDGLNWVGSFPKKAIIFNSKQIISVPPPLDRNGKQQSAGDDCFDDFNSGSVGLGARIVCYCRHQNAPNGFKLLFVLKDYEGNIVGKTFSDNIMIMDRKRTMEAPSTLEDAPKRSKSVDINPITPPSLDEESSDHSKSNKRMRVSGSSSRNVNNGKSNIPNFLNSYGYEAIKGNSFVSPQSSSPLHIDPSALSPLSDNAGSSTNAYNSRSPGDSSAMLTSFTNLSTPVDYTGPSNQKFAANMNMPVIQKVIPSEGNVRGGNEITLLGVNFTPGLKVKFGANYALATHCWSDSTIVTFLPPAASPGQVLVSFEREGEETEETENPYQQDNSRIFTYTDDTDRQLIELALQIVGLKMNGKLQDARKIARRIVGTDSFDDNGNPSLAGDISNGSPNQEQVFNSDVNVSEEENLLMKLISICDLPSAPSSPNWQVCNKENQTMLHLACFKGFRKVVSALINRGARVNCKDINGFTPLHYAALAGHSKIITILFKAKVNSNAKNSNGFTAADVANNFRITALIQSLDYGVNDSDDYLAKSEYGVLRAGSVSSISSIEEDDLRFHVSRMVPDASTEFEQPLLNEGCSESEIFESSENDNADDEGANESDELIIHRRRVVDDSLPQYSDLYPGGESEKLKNSQFFSKTGTSSQEQEVQEPIEEIESVTEESVVEEIDETGLEDNVAFNYYDYFINKNKDWEFKNDKMLFFFWMPILVLFLSIYVYNQFLGFESLDKYTEDVVNYIREALYQFMIGKQRMEALINGHLAGLVADEQIAN